MNRLFATYLGVWGASAALCAGPAEEVIIAAMRLSEQSSYAWTATVADDARTYEVEGQTIRDGFTHVKMPVVNTVRRKLGRSVTDTQIELIFRGNVACVIDTENGWKKPSELPAPPPEGYEESHAPIASARFPQSGAKGTTDTVLRGTVVNWPVPPAKRESAPKAYSNLQLAISHPHEDLGVIVSSHTDLRVEGNIATGTLTELGAQLLLVHDGQESIAPVRAKGTFKLWLQGGMVVKYQVSLDGVISVDSPNGRHEISVQQTADTTIKAVGTTAFAVPEEARRKLTL